MLLVLEAVLDVLLVVLVMLCGARDPPSGAVCATGASGADGVKGGFRGAASGADAVKGGFGGVASGAGDARDGTRGAPRRAVGADGARRAAAQTEGHVKILVKCFLYLPSL